MSIDLFVVTPHTTQTLTPSLIGLGAAPFVWSNADRFEGFEYPGRRLEVSLYADSDPDGITARIRKIAPPEMKTVLSLYLRDYRDDFEGRFAGAVDGFATTDALLYSEIWDEATSDDEELRDAARSSIIYTVHEPYRTEARLSVLGSFWADRYAPETPEGIAMIAHAARGIPGALDVLRFWTGKGRDSGVARAGYDAGAIRQRFLGALDAVTTASADILDLFIGPQGVLPVEPPAIDALARVVDGSAMKAFLARRDKESLARDKQRRFLDDARKKGDFI